MACSNNLEHQSPEGKSYHLVVTEIASPSLKQQTRKELITAYSISLSQICRQESEYHASEQRNDLAKELLPVSRSGRLHYAAPAFICTRQAQDRHKDGLGERPIPAPELLGNFGSGILMFVAGSSGASEWTEGLAKPWPWLRLGSASTDGFTTRVSNDSEPDRAWRSLIPVIAVAGT